MTRTPRPFRREAIQDSSRSLDLKTIYYYLSHSHKVTNLPKWICFSCECDGSDCVEDGDDAVGEDDAQDVPDGDVVMPGVLGLDHGSLWRKLLYNLQLQPRLAVALA